MRAALPQSPSLLFQLLLLRVLQMAPLQPLGPQTVGHAAQIKTVPAHLFMHRHHMHRLMMYVFWPPHMHHLDRCSTNRCQLPRWSTVMDLCISLVMCKSMIPSACRITSSGALAGEKHPALVLGVSIARSACSLAATSVSAAVLLP